jgi:hypothetical protein
VHPEKTHLKGSPFGRSLSLPRYDTGTILAYLSGRETLLARLPIALTNREEGVVPLDIVVSTKRKSYRNTYYRTDLEMFIPLFSDGSFPAFICW